MKGNKLIKILAVMALLISLCAIITGCRSIGAQQDDGSYDSSVITLSGLDSGDMTLSFKEIKEMDSVTEKAQASRSNGETVKIKATGPLLSTLLDNCGISLDD